MPRRRQRVDVIWIALALVAGTGGAVFAQASSSPSAGTPAETGSLQLSATRDPALAAHDSSDAEAVARLAAAAGLPAGAGATPRAWTVGGRRVVGYTSAGGSFCFLFSGGAGGCLPPDALTGGQPLDVMTDYGPGILNVYGLALDGVRSVTVRLGGVSRQAALAHNAFTFSDAGLGGTAAIAGEAIATMRDGTAHAVPFRVGSLPEPVQLP